MRMLTIFLAVAGLSAGVTGGALAQRDAGSDRSPEAKYTKLIAGKTPGKPVDCIDTRFTSPQLSAAGDRLVYRVSNQLVYVSDTGGGCSGVARGDTLVTRQFQTRLCRGDIARTVSLPAGIDTGSCALGSFVPYTSAR